jgi:hypothetical protein
LSVFTGPPPWLMLYFLQIMCRNNRSEIVRHVGAASKRYGTGALEIRGGVNATISGDVGSRARVRRHSRVGARRDATDARRQYAGVASECDVDRQTL